MKQETGIKSRSLRSGEVRGAQASPQGAEDRSPRVGMTVVVVVGFAQNLHCPRLTAVRQVGCRRFR
jgi:hypothetical protein